MLKRLLPSIFLFSFAAATLLAAEEATVDSVLDRFVRAIGGKAAVEKITTLRVDADFDVGGNVGGLVTYQKTPDKYTWRVDMGDVYQQGIAGDKGWKKGPAGIETLSEVEKRSMKKEAPLHAEIQLKSIYPGLQYKGKETRNGEEVHVLESKPSSSIYDRLYFSTKTGFLVAKSSKDGDVTNVSEFGDYRDADGVKRPFTSSAKIESGEGAFEFSLKVKKIQSNVEIKDDIFAEPKE